MHGLFSGNAWSLRHQWEPGPSPLWGCDIILTEKIWSYKSLFQNSLARNAVTLFTV